MLQHKQVVLEVVVPFRACVPYNIMVHYLALARFLGFVQVGVPPHSCVLHRGGRGCGETTPVDENLVLLGSFEADVPVRVVSGLNLCSGCFCCFVDDHFDVSDVVRAQGKSCKAVE